MERLPLIIVFFALASGCAFDASSAGAGNGGLEGDGVDGSAQAGGDTATGQAATLDKGGKVKAPEVQSTPGAQKKQAGRGAAIICKHGNAIGRLLTDRTTSSPKSILVSFENGSRVEEVSLSELELIEVVAL